MTGSDIIPADMQQCNTETLIRVELPSVGGVLMQKWVTAGELDRRMTAATPTCDRCNRKVDPRHFRCQIHDQDLFFTVQCHGQTERVHMKLAEWFGPEEITPGRCFVQAKQVGHGN